METISIQQTRKMSANKLYWTGRIISWICILFLLVDGTMKLFVNHYHVEGTEQLGWNVTAVQPIGIVLLICTILYIIPRTAIIGAILLSAYMGGAVATMARIGLPFYFPMMMAILLWLGLYLRNEKLRDLIKA